MVEILNSAAVVFLIQLFSITHIYRSRLTNWLFELGCNFRTCFKKELIFYRGAQINQPTKLTIVLKS